MTAHQKIHSAAPLPPAVDLASAPATISAPAAAPSRIGTVGRVVVAVLALWLFLSAIAVMKDGAQPLGELLRGSTLTDSGASTLGFGWLGAMLVMSGSPVAVAGLTMFDGGIISASETLTMLTGSRLGAAFVVLVVSFLYSLKGGGTRESRRASLSIGIFALLLTALVYVPALLIGIPLIQNDVFAGLNASAPDSVLNVITTATAPIVSTLTTLVPPQAGLLFLAGLALLLVSIRLIDVALPEASDAAHLDEHTGWRNRKWMMFAVGSLVALVTMSVSVALTVLVPAVAKGYFRRRQIMPYIMGANITTLGDTLLTAFLLDNPVAAHVVLAELVSIIAITLVLMTLLYEPLQARVTGFTDWILDTRVRTIIFVGVLFSTPLALITFLP